MKPDTILTTRRRLLRLRPTLLSGMIGLLTVTVATVGAIAFYRTSRAIDVLVDQSFDTASLASANEVQRLLSPAPTILRELEVLAQRGRLPLDDRERLGELFAERLRQQLDLAWIVYADARRDSFTGATRVEDGSIVFKRSTPEIEGSRPVVETIAPDGRRGERIVENVPYTLWTRPWFTEGIAASGLHWTSPYRFRDGEMGITATLRLDPPGGGEPIGVFTVDFFLSHLDDFLSRLTIGRTGRVYLLGRDGSVIAQSRRAAGAEVDAASRTAIERFRPELTGLALDRPLEARFEEDGTTYRASLGAFSIEGDLSWAILVVAPEQEFNGVVVQNVRWTLGIGLGAFGVAALLASVFATRVSVPLRQISGDLEAVGRLAISDKPSPRSAIREIAVMGDAVDRMKAGLRSFERYIPVELVRDLLRSGREARLGGETRELTIHFSDIAGFTGIAERMAPNAIVAELGEYFELMTRILQQHEGTVDKFMGDGILAFFNAPHPVRGHAAQACRAALEAQASLAELALRREAAGRPMFRARIGLEIGEVLVGNIGTPDRFAYTVIGDAVNLASRLEGLNKFYGTSIVGTERLREAAGPGFEWRRLDRVAVVGRREGTSVSELLGIEGWTRPDILEARDTYEMALAAYFAGDFGTALASFHAAYDARPDDLAAAVMVRRTRKLKRAPPVEWSGIYVQTQK